MFNVGCRKRRRNSLPFTSTWVHPRICGDVRVAPLFSFFFCCTIICLYILISVLWCSLTFIYSNILRIRDCLLTLPEQSWVHPRFFYRVRVAHLFSFLFCFLRSVSCFQCCVCLLIVHIWLPLRFSLLFILYILHWLQMKLFMRLYLSFILR